MKHNFNTPVTTTVKSFNGLPCDCLDCVKNAAYTKQLNDRAAPYLNSFDFPDFNDLKISATQILGYATGNPVAVASASAARTTKAAIKQSTGKTVAVNPTDIAPKPGQAEVNWLGWFGWKTKLLLAVIVAAVLVSMYLRATGK